MLIAGVDIGNSTTEIAIAFWQGGKLEFLVSECVRTTGTKGTPENVTGIAQALQKALSSTSYGLKDLELIFLNEATPVIGDLAMATVTQTIITESAMIGHNPTTPGGLGTGCGKTVMFSNLSNCLKGEAVIVVVPGDITFEQAAHGINRAVASGVLIQGAIVKNNEGVLISNRLAKVIPIVDEVNEIEKVPLEMPAIVEVADPGTTIKELCNPYGIATLLNLDSEQTKKIAPIAMSLIGNKSAVVIKTPQGSIKERRIAAGTLTIIGDKYTYQVEVTEGSAAIMNNVNKAGQLIDVTGEHGTAVGGMLSSIKQTLNKVTGQQIDEIKVRDLLAVDTIVPQKIIGAMAGETCSNQAIGLAAMVWTDKSLMQGLVSKIEAELKVPVHIEGIEVLMALLGALSTPGVDKPVAILDMGAGSVDAARLDRNGNIQSIHLAGAGDMVTMLINSELGLADQGLAEKIKIFPLAKVESLFNLRLEDNDLRFFEKPLSPNLFGRVVILADDGELVALPQNLSLRKVVSVRQEAKRKVFVTNAIRALKSISHGQNLRTIDHVVMLGGSALDFEISNLVSEELLRNYGIVTGKGNIRGKLGPRNAVATGLIYSYTSRKEGC